MKPISKKIIHFKESIFATISAEARKRGAVNLGQGFPDFDCEDWIKAKVKESFDQGHNQYAPYEGVKILREQISNIYQRYYGLNYSSDTDITVTAGATEAIFCTILSLVEEGDEVIVFEPYYDSYLSAIKIAGGTPIPVTLHAPDFSYDTTELKAAFSSKTKLVILNSPHNPSGKMFSRAELQLIADFVAKHDAYILSDEVYEFLTFDGNRHIPFASLPGMQERTMTISSAGKTFGATGWKIGWGAGSRMLSNALRLVHQYNTFAVSTPVQTGVARALMQLDEYLPRFLKDYQEKMDFFFDGLKRVGFAPIRPAGTYFILCPIAGLTAKNDVDYCLELIEKKGVATIPVSAFYMKSDEGKKFLRFCFAKKWETLESALARL